MSELQQAVAGTAAKIILVKPGVYKGELLMGANKTVIGTAPGVLIDGRVEMRADKKDILKNLETYNIIMRNIAVKGEFCDDMRICRDGEDAVGICGGTHHIWLDHMDIYDGQDGNLDITVESDFVTASWCQFRYTYDKPHRFSNLIGDSEDRVEDKGKLKTTLMFCWWGDKVEQRMPRGRWGQVHCFNNFYASKETTLETSYCIGPGDKMAIIVENSVFELAGIPVVHKWSNPVGWELKGNIGNAPDVNQSFGTVFTVPYKYDMIPATEVKAVVTAKVGGAGNTCTFGKSGDTGVKVKYRG
jgi:pectate lyase